MKFDRSNKFNFCYYGQVNSLRLQSSVASKRASEHFGGTIYFAGTLLTILSLTAKEWTGPGFSYTKLGASEKVIANKYSG